MWQHSACHGISKAEAEKDNFHFICRDCIRRAEDAKRPKIPSLKFHIRSSSSPPSQRTKDSEPSANESKKRKSGGEITNMPPLKKFKPVESHTHSPNPLALPRSQAVQDGMHKTMMNGPTLSPQGQILPLAHQNGVPAAQPPPGLQSPPGPPAYSNGYTHVVKHQKGNQARSSSPPPLTNGTPQNIEKPSTGWSARYSPQEPAQTLQRPQPPSPQNPFHNSFDRQPPGSHLTSKISSPIKNRPSLSPPQSIGNTAVPTFPPTPIINGVGISQHPPAHSPVKQSSPPMPSIRQPSSSPIIHPPLLQNAPSSPGFSPTKKSPPRILKSLDMTAASVLFSASNLGPSNDQQVFAAPVKAATPGPEGNTNGVNSGD